MNAVIKDILECHICSYLTHSEVSQPPQHGEVGAHSLIRGRAEATRPLNRLSCSSCLYWRCCGVTTKGESGWSGRFESTILVVPVGSASGATAHGGRCRRWIGEEPTGTQAESAEGTRHHTKYLKTLKFPVKALIHDKSIMFIWIVLELLAIGSLDVKVTNSVLLIDQPCSTTTMEKWTYVFYT